MKSMSKIIIFIFIFLFTLGAFGQDLPDLIVTKEHDSIQCNITFVNNQNIFYEYKNKRRIKSDYISRELVLDFKSTKLDEVSFKMLESRVFKDCDTCENFVVLFSDDTIYYNIVIHRFEHTNHILYVSYLRPNSSTNYYAKDLKSIYWDGIEFTHISLSDKDIKLLRNDFLFKKFLIEWLGVYIIKGNASLIEISYITSSYPYSVPFLVKIYLLEVNKERIVVPKYEKGFVYILKTYLKDNPELIARIKNLELGFSDIEEIIQIYNKGN